MLSNLANDKQKWETTAQLDAGIEFGFLSDNISGSVNYYLKNTTDLLLPVPVSQTSGFDFVLQNLGSMENSGIEVDISANIIERDNFSWYMSFNFSTNNSKITDLGGEDRKLISGVSTFLEGEAPGAFYIGPIISLLTMVRKKVSGFLTLLMIHLNGKQQHN